MSDSAITFVVRGKPEPKGSTRAFNSPGRRFPVVTSDNPKAKGWAATVALVAQQHAPPEPWDGPINIEIHFELQRPKSAPKRVVLPTKKPDLDKLIRCVLDALTNVFWLDDAQVTDVWARKKFGAPGATITVWRAGNG